MTMNRFFIFVAVWLLSGCGFHLKGHYATDHLPVQNWYVDGGQLQQPLENAIRRASGYVVTNPNTQASLRITGLEIHKDVYTITRAATINEYLLSMRVQVQAYYQGRAWGKPLIAEVRRAMPYTDSQILGKQDNEEQLWAEIQADAAEQIIRQLGFIEPHRESKSL